MFDTNNYFNTKILIVDDEPANVKLLDQMLLQAEYKSIRTTTDSREVVEIYQEFQPELVLLDLKMPHLDGFQVMEELNKIENRNYLPVMVLTAQNDKMNSVRALDAGALDFLGKPFDFLEVSLRIKNILKLLSIIKLDNKEVQDLKETIRGFKAELITEKNKVKEERAMRRKCEAELKRYSLSLQDEVSELKGLL
jgi:putative two-component system response regulator